MPADIYLIDEPSAYLDSEQRIVVARVIKRFIMHAKKTAFVVEHDFLMATYLSDRVSNTIDMTAPCMTSIYTSRDYHVTHFCHHEVIADV